MQFRQRSSYNGRGLISRKDQGLNDYVTIGTNATIIPDLEIREGSYVGAGTVVTKNVNKNEIVVKSK